MKGEKGGPNRIFLSKNQNLLEFFDMVQEVKEYSL